VTCLTSLGDVPRIKRFDEYGHDATILAQTYFKSDPYIEHAISRLSGQGFGNIFPA
jgi:hypothetical protein